ncbi:alpha/beta hydrolase family protein [Streptomyces sp. H27-D2]|uniref:alpha/beta hydrolase family protein n=1 Tax=Streptomyces sp. H27-D2 TaxID=3046304 RepID=UPI002DBE685C|nr:lipase family protein [Streptomyces sp. H27-D2]MEC4019134.1 lipase family protein [Streptomyces sp. H27-D2]
MTELDARQTPPMSVNRRARRGATAAAALLVALAATPALAAGPTRQEAPARTAQATRTAPASARTPLARGALLSVTPLERKTRAQVVEFVTGEGVDAAAARHGTASYRLTYATVTPGGAPTTASALLVLPTGGGHRLAAVSENHGTLAYRGNAPSTGDNASRIAAQLYASGGRAVVAPDYLGLGTGPGTHPYVDNRSSVSASLDALRAARTAAAQRGKRLDGDVYVTGFSQGGQVSMALGRELSRGADRHFRLRALAPVSGPYDIEGSELPGMFDGRVAADSAVFYLSYFLVAQNRLHPLYTDPREVFRAPYADRLERLFDSEHPDQEIFKELPRTVKELLTDEWYERVQHPSGVFAEVIRLNDGVCDWAPRVPVRLHTASGDTDVPIANARDCARRLAGHGVRAKVTDHGSADHFGTYLEAVSDNARWFARLD